MDHNPLRVGDFAIDLEIGGITSEEVGSPDHVSGVKLAKTFFNKISQGFVIVDGHMKGENQVGLSSDACDVSPENVKLLIDKKLEGQEAAVLAEKKKTGKEKSKKTSAKKPPKPPRPPRGLSLDDADQKLIKEIAELALMKRARIERMKALKKMKATKASSSTGNLLAILFTILFCLMIIFPGMFSRSNSAVSLQGGSPVSAGVTDGNFILVQNHWNQSASDTNVPGSGSPNLVEKGSGSDPLVEMNGATD